MTSGIRTHRLLAVLAVAFSAGLAAQASAQEVIGEISLTLDGEDRVWQTLRSTDPSVSFNTGVTEYGPVKDISIQGYTEGGSYTEDVLAISLAIMSGGGMVDQTVMHVPEKMSQSWVNPDDEELVTIEHIDDESIRGTVSGRLCFMDGFATPIETDNCVPVEGTFETALPQE
ncbi:hypothetical protein [Roseivivax isoporae]|uniref:Uncharacterized protein n=1 Tax=Roseivivax isoporae LMG 25204 TaxID=1449351 RepID=X7F1B9_9RHOB|nr:hypothetical protein [Roseivivax isoporae]ETX26717.1 hypothetical protein RISW2_20510 [Roseivivax isoporae LMG 25204]